MFSLLKSGFKEKHLGASDFVRLEKGRAAIYNSYFMLEQALPSSFHENIACSVLGAQFFKLTDDCDNVTVTQTPNGRLKFRTDSGTATVAAKDVTHVPNLSWLKEDGASEIEILVRFDGVLPFCDKGHPSEILRAVWVKDGHAYVTDRVSMTRMDTDMPDCLLPFEVCKFFKSGILAKVSLKGGAVRFDFQDGARMQSGVFSGKYPALDAVCDKLLPTICNVHPYMFGSEATAQLKRMTVATNDEFLTVTLASDTMKTEGDLGEVVEHFEGADWQEIRASFKHVQRAIARGLIYLWIADDKLVFANSADINEAEIVHIIGSKV